MEGRNLRRLIRPDCEAARSSRAEDGIRTRDPHLGKVRLVHLVRFGPWTRSFVWRGVRSVSRRPTERRRPPRSLYTW